MQQAEATELAATIAVLASECTALHHEVAILQQQRADTIAEAVARTAAARQENVTLDAERTRLTNHVEHLQEEQRAMNDRRNLLVTQITEARDQLAHTRTDMATVAATLSTLQQNQQTLQAVTTILEEKCAALRTEQASLEDAIAQAKERIAQARERIAQAKIEHASIVQRRYMTLPDKQTGREPEKIIPIETLADGAVNVLGAGLGSVLKAGDTVVARIRSLYR